MTNIIEINPIIETERKIYGYTLPIIPDRIKYVKVGQTTRDVATRINEQLSQAGLIPKIYFDRVAKHSNGEYFTDYDLHQFFEKNDIKREDFGTSANEWFYFGDHPEQAEILTDKFINMDYSSVQKIESTSAYTLRKEQEDAVCKTIEYYKRTLTNPLLSKKFLWNAKPRFGKTLTTYDMIRRLELTSVLIITNRPAIANSWYDDFVKFIRWQDPTYLFISESDSITKKGPISREEYITVAKENLDSVDGFISFYSLQDLKGSDWAGGDHAKNDWITKQEFDLVVIDESHEGVDTFKTDKLLEKIQRKFTLHLSGTPFKALASNKFNEEQIYNWSYADEQRAKKEWPAELDTNPYENLPTLHLFTYQMSRIMEQYLEEGVDIDDKNLDYTFDLNEFFSTKENGTFVYESSVKLFLKNICQGKYPFAPSEYRHKLNHTLWLLNRVDSAKALEKLLREDEFFKDYKVVLAAGDGEVLRDDGTEEIVDNNEAKKSLDKVRRAIKENEKTITLSVGQLTTGVTVPEWTGVMILSNIQSPALYFQAAFRAQNPYSFTDEDNGKLYIKENAYVFDFAPERTLIQFDEFANNLRSDKAETRNDRKENIKELINFFPVVAEDKNGRMYELNAEEVLEIPSALKATEVVRSGFMSNFLFENISAIFRVPKALEDIINKLKKPFEENRKKTETKIPDNINLDENGDIIPDSAIVINQTNSLFGPKIYKDAQDQVDSIRKEDKPDKFIEDTSKLVDDYVDNKMDFSETQKTYNFTDRDLNKNKKDLKDTIKGNLKKEYESATYDIEIENKQIENKEKELGNTKDEKAIEELKKEIEDHQAKKKEIENNLYEKVAEVIKGSTEEHVINTEIKVKEKIKKSSEDEVREKLRGFSRTIPSFLMSYGNRDVTLQNYDQIVDPDDFLDVTGITVDDFKILRDGFTEKIRGKKERIPGFFNEPVFNSSIQEFYDTRDRLSDYYKEEQKEDIFDFIPSQKTNQKFTPRWVVEFMLDILEKEYPNVFSDRNLKFADIYSKSGMFVVEIIKRLNKGLETEIPDQKERLKWIIENQVYALAPTKTIYNISKNYIMSDFKDIDDKNIKLCDLVPAAKQAKAKEEIEKLWGEGMKFDIIIGNPPYQENNSDRNRDDAIYHYFYDAAFSLADTVTYITPARFLFNIGSTNKEWNKKMLEDEHLCVKFYEKNSEQIFPGADIKGGLAITLRDRNKNLGPIGEFTSFKELDSILEKVSEISELDVFGQIMYVQLKFNLDVLLSDYPEYEDRVGNNRERRLVSSSFDRFPEVFRDTKKDGDICVLGRQNNQRVYKFINRRYIQDNGNLETFKVILPAANGSGAIGEVLSTPLIGEPLIGHTQTFISLGSFADEYQAKALLKYIKSKFARTMLGIRKITQNNKTPETWSKVPLQDFTENSDIDWNKSIAEIDQQLYKKYGLSQEEINFIEEKVAPME